MRGGLAALLLTLALAAPAGAEVATGPAAILARFATAAEGAARVLFIGNSFTLEHGVARQVIEIAAAEGVTLEAGVIARGGARLHQHAADPATRAAVADIGWDALVLQDYSTEPLTAEGAGRSAQAVAGLAALTPARLVLFATWPRQAGHAYYERPGAPARPAEMNRVVVAHYRALTERHGAALAAVGDAFVELSASGDGPPLWRGDGYHASREGSRVAAALLFRAIAAVLAEPPPQVPGLLPASAPSAGEGAPVEMPGGVTEPG